jgi:hypothetical protein
MHTTPTSIRRQFPYVGAHPALVYLGYVSQVTAFKE